MNYQASALLLAVLVSGCAQKDSATVGCLDPLAPVKKAVNAGAFIVDVTGRTPTTVTHTDGGGISIGHGYVLTAAHVLEQTPIGTRVNVVMNGNLGDATIAAMPEAFAPGHDDVAVLRLSAGWLTTEPAPFYPLCLASPTAGTEVYVVSRGAIDFKKLNWQAERTPPQLVATYEGGKSGSAVIDAKRECIAGVISFGERVDFTRIEENTVIGMSDAGGMAYTPSTEIVELLRDWDIPFIAVP